MTKPEPRLARRHFPSGSWYSSNILTVLVLTSDQVKLIPLASSWSALVMISPPTSEGDERKNKTPIINGEICTVATVQEYSLSTLKRKKYTPCAPEILRSYFQSDQRFHQRESRPR